MLSTNLLQLQTDQLCQALDQKGYTWIDDAYPEAFFLQLQQECLQHLAGFREAAIQNGVVSSIRSDHILWINPELATASVHLQQLEALGQALNQAFFLGIKNVEAHYACYQAGEFYGLHRDNPQQKNHRVISAVLYLTQDWQTEHGGILRLQDKHGDWLSLEPKPNRLAIFQSDLLHEVLPAQMQRLSLTAWLRSDQALW